MNINPEVEPATDPFDGAGESMDEAALCALVARDVLHNRYRWAPELGWMAWDGRIWRRTPSQDVADQVRRFFLGCWRAALNNLAETQNDQERTTAENIVKGWKKTLALSRINNIVTLTQGIPTILTRGTEFDAHPDLLNVGNGIIELDTGELRPHDPQLLLTRITPVDYHYGSMHPDWSAALAALPEDVRPWAQLRYGQAITGHMPPDDLLIVHDGSGENGKTTLAEAFRAALGDYFVQVSHRALLGDASQHPTELMTFRGARFALLEELPEGRRMNVNRLKMVVGTPHLRARLIAKDEIEFKCSHSLFLNTNHLPVIDETDHGTWRRLARLRFPYRFLKPDAEPQEPNDRWGDPNLRQRLHESRGRQAEAVLAWLVAGAVAWYANDRVMPTPPERVANDTHEWRSKSDLLLNFADEELEFDGGSHVMSKELLGVFNQWLKARGHKEWSITTLAARLDEHDHFKGHGVEPIKVRLNDALSRPRHTFEAAPGQYRGFHGLKFRQSEASFMNGT